MKAVPPHLFRFVGALLIMATTTALLACNSGSTSAGDAGANGGGNTSVGSTLCRTNRTLETSAKGAACRKQCRSELQTCESSSDCVELDCCIAQCAPGTSACETECWNAKLGKTAPLTLVDHCVLGCIAGASLCRMNALLEASATGAACRSQCASKLKTCEDSTSCVALDCCLAKCEPTDTTCNTACSNANKGATVSFAYANQCISNCI